MEKTQIILQATQAFESNNFEEAISKFYLAAGIAEPSDDLLSNLTTAEKLQKLQFYRNLCEQYPDSFSINLMTGSYWDSIGYKRQASEHFTRSIARFNEEPKHQLLLKYARFKVNCSNSIYPIPYELLKEDFSAVWNTEMEIKIRSHYRIMLLKFIYQLSYNENGAKIIQEIKEYDCISGEVKTFLESVLNNIEVFNSLKNDLMSV